MRSREEITSQRRYSASFFVLLPGMILLGMLTAVLIRESRKSKYPDLLLLVMAVLTGAMSLLSMLALLQYDTLRLSGNRLRAEIS